VQAIEVSQSIDDAIMRGLRNCLTRTDLGLGHCTVVSFAATSVHRAADYATTCTRPARRQAAHVPMGAAVPVQGKVRDVYELDDRLVIVTTDRQSAFDRILAAVPFKVCRLQRLVVLTT
jgi:SAICAR synthetase